MRIEKLTREAFAPFGDVITLDGAQHYPINDGMTERFHDSGLGRRLRSNRKTIDQFVPQQTAGLTVRGKGDGTPSAWQPGLLSAL